MDAKTEKTKALLLAFGAAALYLITGWLLALVLPAQPLVCTLLQPIPVLALAAHSRVPLGVCRPKRWALAPVGLFLGLMLFSALLLPEQTGFEKEVWSALRLCLAAPLAEELVFRGAIQGTLQPLGGRNAVWVQAALFAAQHGGAAGMLYALCMGLALGWLREQSGSVLPGMLLHILNNLLVFYAG